MDEEYTGKRLFDCIYKDRTSGKRKVRRLKDKVV